MNDDDYVAQEVEFIWLRGLSENIFIYLHD